MSKNITIDNVSFDYEIKRSTKRKIYIRVKESLVIVSCPKTTKVADIEELLKKNIKFIEKQLVNNKKSEYVHLNGLAYEPRFILSNKSGVTIDGDTIYIYSKKNDIDSFKNVLYKFYKSEVERELTKIIYEAKCDFPEINFPTISVRYMVSMFGNYNRKKHHIKLSSILAKYDYKYIKFILYHELCHVLVFNHKKEFYDLYEKKYFNAKTERKLFKKIKYHDYI